ncbi:MAG: SCO family protein [Candidatus Promineifilaceae bacterium]|nr:SCO family protein [Candidatus Promineifilaceae bacterium]
MSDLASEAPASAGRIRKPTFKLVWLFYLVLALFLLSVISFATFRPILVLPRITLAPGYSLVDQNGDQLTNEDMRGKITLYNVSHTNCSYPCPDTGLIMKEVQDQLKSIDTGGIPVELVTISINPEQDTPEALRTYAGSLGADNDRWHFVTGPIERLRWVVGDGFRLYFNKQDDGEIVFDPGIMLVDGLGILRAEYRSANPNVDRIVSDIELIAEEVHKSDGANKVAYEAAHLFMCYPRG